MNARKTALLALLFASVSTAALADSYHVRVWNGAATDCGVVDCLFSADNADAPPPAEDPFAEFHFTPDDAALGIQWATNTVNTYEDFLRSGVISGYSGVLGLSSFLSSSMSVEGNAFASYFEITGSYSSGASFISSIMHDDGASLYVDGTPVFQAPGLLTGQATAGPHSFAAGHHSFALYFIAADGGPSVLQFALPGARASAIPEPDTVALLGLGVAALAFIRRRKTA